MTELFAKKEIEAWNKGVFWWAYRVLGSQSTDKGIRFAVWAPNAHRVSVVGDFNGWDSQKDPMERDDRTGIWHITLAGAKPNDCYKYAIQASSGSDVVLKSDPYARYFESQPGNASVIYDIAGFSWSDEQWMECRSEKQSFGEPISIYEVHLASWKRMEGQQGVYPSYRELASELIPYVVDMGFTHIELMPVSEYPYDPSWGYQVTGYFAPTSRYGEPVDFMYFINECHKAGIGVIIDWVPAHFPKDEQGLHLFDGTSLYEHEHPLRKEQKDWGTLIFDYEKAGVRNFLLSNAVWWCGMYHIDGLRIDAVASMLYLDYSKAEGEWLPNKYGGKENLEAINFLKTVHRVLDEHYPAVCTFAEESTAWPGVTESPESDGLGFDYKWNMGWMNDTLSYLEMEVAERKKNPEKITFPFVYTWDEKFVLPLSHDEVVHLKKPLLEKAPGERPDRFANLRLLYAYMFGHPGKKLVFMGNEIAVNREWSENDVLRWQLLETSKHAGVRKLFGDLLTLYRAEASLHRSDHRREGFSWVDMGKQYDCLFSFKRESGYADRHLVFLLNFSDQNIDDYRLDLPAGVDYEIVLNTDSHFYGGENRGGIQSHSTGYTFHLPPFSGIILRSGEAMEN